MILVAGATGSLGGKVVRSLLDRGEPVRGLVRPSSEHGALEQAGMEVAIGDLRDPASLARACRGVDVVVSTASATRRADDTPENVDARGNENLIAAAKGAEVEQYVLVSTNGASAESPVPAFRAKAAAEAALEASGLTWTILQPDAFMDVWFGMMVEMPIATGQPVTLVGESRRRHSFVAERDVAAFIVAAIGHPSARDARLPIGGPAAVTFREVVDAYAEALGREVPVRSVAPGEPIPGLPEPVWGIAAGLESYDSPVPMEELTRTFGVTLTSAREFASSSALARASVQTTGRAMADTHARRVGLALVATAVLGVGLPAGASAQDGERAPAPRFVEVWFGGALDSIYGAEDRRLSRECAGVGDSCWVEGLDTTAVPLVPVWAEPDADEPVGRLVARLRTEDGWPHAALIFQGSDGREVTLQAYMGDWGYGSTLAIRDWRDGFFQPWILEPVGDYWLGESGEGYGVVAAPFGLEGRLWRLGPVRAAPVPDETALSPPATEPLELPLAVYKILSVQADLVRLRPEIPRDMDCEPGEPTPTGGPMPVYEVPLARLLDPSGRPRMEVAYPKGC